MSFEINERITKYRKQKKMTKRALAATLGINYSTYCRMENEAKRIDPKTASNIAEILGVDPDLIIYGEKPLDFSPVQTPPLVAKDPNAENPFFTESVSVKHKYDTGGEFQISEEEKVIVTLFRNFDEEKKQKVRDLINEIK